MNDLLSYHAKNLSNLPVPELIEQPDYEALLRRRYDYFNGISPVLFDQQGKPVIRQSEIIRTEQGQLYHMIPADDQTGLWYLELDSDPIPRQLQVDAYLEMHQRNQFNQSCLAMMPAFATGKALDHLASRDQVYRLLISEADGDTPAIWEKDEPFRRRWLLSREAKSAGGSPGWYLYHALTADPLVKDVLALSPNPRGVELVILSHEGNGTASPELLEKVEAHVRAQYTEVMTDIITVKSAEVIEYEIDATLEFYHGVSNELTIAHIERAFAGEPLPLASGSLQDNYRQRTEKIGHWISDSAVKALIHPAGSVYRAVLNTPATLPIEISQYQAPYCTDLNLHDGGEHGLL